jgi:hypothetical protein
MIFAGCIETTASFLADGWFPVRGLCLTLGFFFLREFEGGYNERNTT